MPATLPNHFTAAIANQDWQWIIRSPGRINLIGEHTDYNGGLVFPAAIDSALYFAARPIAGEQLQLNALDIQETASINPRTATPTGRQWVDYLLGICQEFIQLGHQIPALEIVFGGDLPSGSGMSSSAALEGGMAFLLNLCTSAGVSRPGLAQLCQRSSNHFMGIPSGIMDQFASLNGQAAKALLLDCANLEFKAVPADLPDYNWVLLNSKVTHDLAHSEYPTRVRECQTGFAAIQARYPAVESLCQATLEQLVSVKSELTTVVFQRCAYAIQEQGRVLQAAAALQAADAVLLGQLLNQTHAGLRDGYQISCAEVDFLQAFAQQHPAVAGSRIMGGGFGGCTINLVATSAVDEFVSAAQAAYLRKYKIKAPVYHVSPAMGTELLS
ncbi:MAG: galactokinase [Bacteroidota bacterium]